VEPIAIRASQRLALVGALAGSSFVVGGLLLFVFESETTPESDLAAAGIFTLFFAALTAVLAVRVFRTRPLMVLSDEGVVDHRLKGVGVVPWAEFEGASVKRHFGFSVVCLRLRDPDAVLGALPAWRRRLLRSNLDAYGTEWAINLTGTGTSAQAVVDAVNRQVALHGRRVPGERQSGAATVLAE
jgi:hypothetical protein